MKWKNNNPEIGVVVYEKNVWKKEFIVCKGDIPRFAKMIKDKNPLHHNSKIAMEMGFKGIIAPGVMIMGFISATIAEMIPTATVYRLEEVDFLNSLYGGSIVQVICTILKQKKSIAKVKVEVYSTVAIARGSCLLLIPQRKRQQTKELEKYGDATSACNRWFRKQIFDSMLP